MVSEVLCLPSRLFSAHFKILNVNSLSLNFPLWYIQCVPLATESGIYLIILPLMRILLLCVATIRRTTDTHYSHTLQTHTTDTFLLISYTTNVLFIGVRITSIKEMPGSVASGTHCIHRVSQEERTKLRESVPYVKLYRYNPKHLYPKLNGYGDNGKRSLKL